MSDYIPTIGLEIHAELKTQTKMFCNSKNDPSEIQPNINICPICLAHPGTLPVINKEAVRHVLRVGVAIKGELAMGYTEFDRKNYFYPDLPKGYQISQYEYPLVSGGELNGVAITRVHLEEDTASSVHDDNTGETLIDFNRAGVPLMELVTEPVITSAREAGDFARELQLLLRYLKVSDAHMEKGEMRVEANVSVSASGERGTKVEIKNLNSFRAMERAVAYEIKRQTELLEKGEKVTQETRGWDEARQVTFAQRIKEGSADYRYFPDPDLPSLTLSELQELSLNTLKETMPELPQERRARYMTHDLKKEDTDLFVADNRFGDFFDTAISCWKGAPEKITLAANYLANDIVKIIRDIEKRDSVLCSEIPISAEDFGEIIDMIVQKEISSRSAKDLMLLSMSHTENPRKIAKEKGLYLKTDKTPLAVIDALLEENKKSVEDYKAGKTSALQFLVGQGMKATKGTADPEELQKTIQQRLS